MVCAAKDLQILGVHFLHEYLETLRRNAAGQPKHSDNVPKGPKPPWSTRCRIRTSHTSRDIPRLVCRSASHGKKWKASTATTCRSRETTSGNETRRARGIRLTDIHGWNVHEAARAVPHIHRNVHEAASTATRGSGHSSVLSGDAAISAQHDCHARAARSYFENAWGSSIDSGPCRSGATPTVRVIRTAREAACGAGSRTG